MYQNQSSEAVQIVSMTFHVAEDVLNLSFKLGKGVFKVLQSLAFVVQYAINKEQLEGIMDLSKLLKQTGGDIQVVSYKTEDKEKLKGLIERYKIPYSELPDLNHSDGMSEIAISSSDIPRMELVLRKLQDVKLKTMEEYVENAEPECMEQIKKETRENIIYAKDLEEEKKIEELKNLSDFQEARHDKNKKQIIISKDDIVQENKYSYIVSHHDGSSVAISKFGSIEHDNNIITYMDQNKLHDVYDADGSLKGMMKGADVYEQYFDLEGAKEHKNIIKRINEAAYYKELQEKFKELDERKETLQKEVGDKVKDINIEDYMNEEEIEVKGDKKKGSDINMVDENELEEDPSFVIKQYHNSMEQKRLEKAEEQDFVTNKDQVEDWFDDDEIFVTEETSPFMNIQEKKEYAKNSLVEENNKDSLKITLNEKMVMEELENNKLLTRIPYEKNRFVILEKNNVIDEGKTVVSHLNKKKDYDILDKEKNIVKQMKGEELHKYYDKVKRNIVKEKQRETIRKTAQKVKNNIPNIPKK